MAESRATLWRYYLFRITNSAGFYVPIAVLYLEQKGFGLDFVGLSYAVFALTKVAAEIPTGYLGDWLGRRGSLAVGSALRATALGAYPLVNSGAAYLLLHVVWASGFAFRSGTQDAWLYEVLKAEFDESEYARIDSRGSTALLVTSAVTAIAGGVLYGIDPEFPFVANAALAAAGLPVLFTFPSVGPDECGGNGDTADLDCPGDETFTVREAVRMLRLQVERPEVRWLVAYAALFSGLFSLTRTFEQPALDSVGVPVAGLGVLYAGFKLVSAGAASTVGWLKDRLGVRGVLALVAPAYAVVYAGIAVVPYLIVPALFFNRATGVVMRPVRNQYLNDRLGDVGRATVLSGASMVLSLAGAAANLAGGWMVARTGPLGFLPWAGVAIAGAAGLLWLGTSPVRSADESTEQSSGETEGVVATD